jgi:hypothetical protein
MKPKILNLIVLAVIMLTACGAPSAAPTPPSSPLVTPTLPSTPLATPTEVRPGGGLITQPQAEQWANAPAGALNARKMLVDQLKVDVDTIGLVSVEKVDWPDACLGVYTPGIACAQVITTGYKVILTAAGQQYEFHTNESGDGVKLLNTK